MKISVKQDGIWYHGSNQRFAVLRENSTITQWKELAEAFSHQPSRLSYDDHGVIYHNGTQKGYLYIIEEPISVGIDIYQCISLGNGHQKEINCSRSNWLKGGNLAIN